MTLVIRVVSRKVVYVRPAPEAVVRRVKIGTADRLKAALWASEDSETLNTSFVERLNLTIRQASAYLRRHSPCHARGADQLPLPLQLRPTPYCPKTSSQS